MLGTSWLFSATLGGIIFSLTLQMWQLRLREMWWPSVSPTANHSYTEPAAVTWAHAGCFLSHHTVPNCSSWRHPNTEPGSKAKPVQTHFYSPHSATQGNVNHWLSYHPLSPQIKSVNTKAKTDLRNHPAHLHFHKRKLRLKVTEPMVKDEQNKLSSYCPWAVKHHSLPVPREVSAHAHV